MTTEQALAQLEAIRVTHLARFKELDTVQRKRVRHAWLLTELAVETNPSTRERLQEELEYIRGGRS